MPYTYRDDIAKADVAFEASGRTIEELFAAAADATMNIMVDDIAKIQKKQELDIELENEALDLLLFNFINELIFFKDARCLLLRVENLSIYKLDTGFVLKARLFGEEINPEKHTFRVDAKAATLHLLEIMQTDNGWSATVVVDV